MTLKELLDKVEFDALCPYLESMSQNIWIIFTLSVKRMIYFAP